jgi:transcriptional regulator with XRE-family HTH domain
MPRLSEDAPHVNGKKLRRLRLGRGLSQEELASAINMHRRTIIRLEKGDVPASSSTLRVLAAYFSVAREELIIGRYNYRDPPPVDNDKWYSIKLHVAGDHSTLDIITLEIQLRDVLSRHFLNNLHIDEITECDSTLISLIATADAVNGVLSQFEQGDFRSTRSTLLFPGGRPGWQSVGLVRRVNSIYLPFPTAYVASGHRATARRQTSKVLRDLSGKWPQLTFRVNSNRITATRRRARRRATALMS